MEDDYLSPVLAKLAAPDLTQRFLPMSIAAFDRSTGLEMAWEQSYRDATNDSTFDQAFLQLRDTSARPTTPLLLLNATHVETGRRYIASSSQLAGIVHDAADIHHALGDTVDLPLSTAVHNSARFTYVSPPGRLATSDTLGHVVDGGYFENSGLVTVQELFAAISRDTLGIARRRPLVVIYLCNDAKSCAHDINPVIRDSSAKAPPGLGNEALGPVNAVLNARDARGSLARAQLLQAVDSAHFIQLNVCDSVPRLLTTAPDTAVKPDAQVLEQSRKRAVSPPLGWLLSKLARDWMDASISAEPMRGDGVCRTHNVAARRRLSSFLGGGR